MSITTHQKIYLTFSLAVVIFAAAGLAAYQTIGQLVAAAGRGEHTQGLLGKLSSLLFYVQEAESAGRGFALTGQEGFLSQIEVAIAKTDQKLLELKSLTSGNSPQQLRLEAIKEDVGEKFAYLRLGIDARQREGLDRAAAWTQNARGGHLMSAIARQVDAMHRHEQRLLLNRSQRAVAEATRTADVFLCLMVIALLLLLTAGLQIRRELGGRSPGKPARAVQAVSAHPILPSTAEE